MGKPLSLCCGTVCVGRVREGTIPLAGLSAGVQSLPQLPTSKLGPSGTDSWVGGFVYILGPWGSLQQTLQWGWEFLLLLQPPQVFTARGFEALFPGAGTLDCIACLAPQLFFLVICTQMQDLLALQLPAYHASSLRRLPISAPPTCLYECFLFNSLVVQPPYSLIFWQFCLFFAFKFVVVLLFVAWGGKVYIPMPPSWPEVE